MRIEATVGRVEKTSPRHVNEMIRKKTECSLLHYAARPEQIDRRLAELDQEWDIERTLQAQASSVVLTGLVLWALRGRRWLGLSAFSGYFLLQHALQGWCPPVALFRRMGIRTAHEIEIERCALKALRGDFGDVNRERDIGVRVDTALRAAGGHVARARGGIAEADLPPTDEPRERDPLAERRQRTDEPRQRPGTEERGHRGGREGPAGPPGFVDGV